jgi:hypothetical protein
MKAPTFRWTFVTSSSGYFSLFGVKKIKATSCSELLLLNVQISQKMVIYTYCTYARLMSSSTRSVKCIMKTAIKREAVHV